MNEEDDKIAGIAAANLVAIEALNDALVEAEIIPEDLVVRAIRETLNPKDPEGGFNEGAGGIAPVGDDITGQAEAVERRAAPCCRCAATAARCYLF